ncbi:hypothetical protein [Polyangium jinanense]|uniref:Uncharacterized protein n=1 Tax=Polyangium jinanense TaxID=2829994 RepID=A0A9X3XC27_9BACT|nr:hypothetical protein [Polyangium jinanense]MDC3960170.1 hypothetical protein [Polyangium jinanense]MDC3986610.1 hypothetical protein [Polyangium jinanense]
MADDYIDYMECAEYADHLYTEGQKLVGASPLVDVSALLSYVKGAADAVSAELSKQTLTTSAARGGRADVEAQAEAGRKEVTRFFKYLGTLADDVPHDKQAFFPGGKQGDVKKLKPADVQKKLAKVLAGFDANANALLPEAAKWKARLVKAEADLGAAIGQKTSTVGTKIIHTAELVAARQAFLKAYTNVAKPLVRGLLAKLGREDEFSVYFKDTTVVERRPRKKGADETVAPS